MSSQQRLTSLISRCDFHLSFFFFPLFLSTITKPLHSPLLSFIFLCQKYPGIPPLPTPPPPPPPSKSKIKNQNMSSSHAPPHDDDHHHHQNRRRDSISIDGSSSSSSSRSNHQQQQQPQTLSRYESQKRRDWNTFGQYLRNQAPPVSLVQCSCNHVLDFLRYLDQFGKTKVHLHGCVFFGQPDPPAPCTCPLRQAWGSLDALIGRLRAAYEEHGGSPETNPFGNGAIRVYLREVKECQAKARGIPYKKKKKRRNGQLKSTSNDEAGALKHIASS